MKTGKEYLIQDLEDAKTTEKLVILQTNAKCCMMKGMLCKR